MHRVVALFYAHLISPWLRGYRRIVVFSGRETRRSFAAFLALHYGLLLLITQGGMLDLSHDVLAGLGLFSLLVTLSYNVRRLHDSNRSGLLCLAYCLAAAPVVVAVSLFLSPDNRANPYGPDPRHGNY